MAQPDYQPSARWCRPVDQGVRLSVRVSPGGKRDEVLGLLGDAIKIRIAAPAVDGKANAALIRFLAGQLRLRERDVAVVAGLSSRSKVVHVSGIAMADVASALLPDQRTSEQDPL